MSAECVNVKHHNYTPYEKKVIPKSDAQLKRIHDAVAHSFLFDNLNGDQKKEIFDAMFEKTVTPGEVVIQQARNMSPYMFVHIAYRAVAV